MTKTTIELTDINFRITIPEAVRKAEGLELGDIIEIDIKKIVMPQKVEFMDESGYLRERMHESGLKTVEGTIISFLKGKTKKNVAVGIIQKAMENITIDELASIFTKIEKDPIYLPKSSPSEKVEKLKQLKVALGFTLMELCAPGATVI